MMRSTVRRLRLGSVLAVVVFLVYVSFIRHSDVVDVYRKYGSSQAVGGGSVLRPDLQKPETHEPPLEDRPEPELHSDPLDRASSGEEELSNDAESPPSIDDLLHSPPAMEPQEPAKVSTSTSTSTSPSTSTSTPETTSMPTTPESPSLPSEDDFVKNPNGHGWGRQEVSVDPHTTAVHWSRMPEHFAISSTIPLPAGTPKAFPRIQRATDKLSAHGADEERLKAVKAAAQHSWKGYRLFAFPQDEVKPVSSMASNPFNGWGATLVDSLDTLWVMGMEEEFEEAVQAVAKIDFTTSPRSDIPLFETVIRYLGGLIAAYDVSGKKYITLLDKAVELAEVLYGAFDTPNRAPMTYYRWKPYNTMQPKRASSRVILAEVGTLSLEFTRLAQLTGEPKYYDAIARLTDMFEEWQNKTRLPGMWPTYFDASGCGDPVEPPTSTTEQQESAPDTNDPLAVPDADKLHHQAQPGPLEDDGAGLPSSDDELFNEDAHGNTYKRKRQLEAASDPLLVGEVVENGNQSSRKGALEAEASSDPSLAGHVVENSDNTAHPEHELRAPPDVNPGSITPPVRIDDGCGPQGFVSASETSQESYTLSGMSDSMYEYLPKEYILLGGQVDQYRTMYLDSADVAIKKLLYKPMTEDERDILMSGELRIMPNYSQPRGERDYIERFTPEAAHLACFAGGMFALGGIIFDRPEHVEIGSKLTDGCVWTYNVTATGIMPEGAILMPCQDTWGECKWNETEYYGVLDPYEDSRTQMVVADSRPNPPDPVPVQLVGGDESHERTSDADTTQRTETDEMHTSNLNEHAHDETRSSDGTLAKRQLEAPTDADEDSEAQRPPPPTPANTPDRIPIYTPPTPLSHREFVSKKIEDEGLPPGFVHINSRKYILRPEAIESVFYMYRITGDAHWREVGWDMFTSIDEHTRAAFGHSAIDDITKEFPAQMDQMESFWLAETLKYFYLLFDSPERWSLDEWVLNTEAHLFARPRVEFV